MIEVLLANDRKGLCAMIEEDGDFRVIAEAGDGETALALIKELGPRIAVLDISTYPGSCQDRSADPSLDRG